jgi:hypothetical protein
MTTERPLHDPGDPTFSIPAHQSADDPRVTLEEQLGVFEAVPPFPPRTEREAEFYSLRDGEMLINMGPHHPATHGVMRIVMKLNGEQIVDIDPVLGYLHRGVEKICENADYHHTITHLDPLEYVSSLFCEWPAVMAYEKLLDVAVPRRAEYIRVLTGELNRISSHALAMGFQALDLGGLTPILYSFIERDEIVDMLASITGQRMLFNYFRIGGVNGDLNHEFMSRLGDWMGRAGEQIQANMGLLNENEIFVRRNRGLGTMDPETALRMCWTGPNLRASGIPYDLRRAHPYSVYPGSISTSPLERGRRPGRYLPVSTISAEPPDHRPVPPPDAGWPDHGQAAATDAAPPGTRVRRRRRAPWRVRGLRHQRRERPAVPLPDPRSELPAPPVVHADDARAPHRRLDGDERLARPDWRGRQ